jgi:glyoxylase-like metal-dependent hydrolase (beta-lactamase superfamily II)
MPSKPFSRFVALTALALIAVSPRLLRPAAASQTASPDRIRVQLLSTGAVLYLLYGGGGNSIVLVRDEGVVLIDSKRPGMGQAVVDAVGLVTDKPITTVINTHGHLDHVGGNLEIPTVTEIVAHEGAAAAMRRMDAFAGPGAKRLPTKTVRDKMSLFDGRDRIDLYYFGPGHTNGDLIVVLPGHDVAYLGDLFPLKAAAPAIDVANGGSGVAFPETLERALKEISGITRVVAGHDPGPPPGTRPGPYGKVQTWEDLQEYAAFNRAFLDAVKSGLAQRRNPAEIAAKLSLPPQYAGYDLQQAKTNIEIIARELSGSAGSAR